MKSVFKQDLTYHHVQSVKQKYALERLTVITSKGSLKSSLKYKEKADPKLAVLTLEKSTVMLFICKINQKSTEPPYAHKKYQVI